jgi:hypothetical protein
MGSPLASSTDIIGWFRERAHVNLIWPLSVIIVKSMDNLHYNTYLRTSSFGMFLVKVTVRQEPRHERGA